MTDEDSRDELAQIAAQIHHIEETLRAAKLLLQNSLFKQSICMSILSIEETEKKFRIKGKITDHTKKIIGYVRISMMSNDMFFHSIDSNADEVAKFLHDIRKELMYFDNPAHILHNDFNLEKFARILYEEANDFARVSTYEFSAESYVHFSRNKIDWIAGLDCIDFEDE